MPWRFLSPEAPAGGGEPFFGGLLRGYLRIPLKDYVALDLRGYVGFL